MKQGSQPSLKKVTTFSEVPQVFEYVSKTKIDSQSGNDSLLLGDDQDHENQLMNGSSSHKKVGGKVLSDENWRELNQISTDLAEIEAYLNQDPLSGVPNYNSLPIEEVVENVDKENATSPETKNVESRHVGNSELAGKETHGIQKVSKIRNTMNISDLINLVKEDEKQKDVRKQQSNRITIDMMALAKILEENETTPFKAKARLSGIFSAIKKPSKEDITLSISQYFCDVNRKKAKTKNENSKLIEKLKFYKRELFEAEKRFEAMKFGIEKTKSEIKTQESILREKIKRRKEIMGLKLDAALEKIESKLGMRVTKYEKISGDNREMFRCGHFEIDGLFMKIKQKEHKKMDTQIKVMCSRGPEQSFIFSKESISKIIRNCPQHFINGSDSLLEIGIRIRNFISFIKDFDEQLSDLDLLFCFKEFQLTKADILTFKTQFSSKANLNFELKVIGLSSTDPNKFQKNIEIYNTSQHQYVDLNLLSLDFKSQNGEEMSFLFEIMKQVVGLYVR